MRGTSPARIIRTAEREVGDDDGDDAAMGHPGLCADRPAGAGAGDPRLAHRGAARPGQPRPGHGAGLGRRVRGPAGPCLVPGAARRPRGRRRLHPAAQRAAPALGGRRGRRRQARAVREAPGPRRERGRRDGAALPQSRPGPDGGVHVAASAPEPGAAAADPRRRDRRAAADPVVVLVPDRAGRLAAGPGARRRRPLGRGLLRRERRPVLRRRRAGPASGRSPGRGRRAST